METGVKAASLAIMDVPKAAQKCSMKCSNSSRACGLESRIASEELGGWPAEVVEVVGRTGMTGEALRSRSVSTTPPTPATSVASSRATCSVPFASVTS